MYVMSIYHEKGSIIQIHVHSHIPRSGKGAPKQMTWANYVFSV